MQTLEVDRRESTKRGDATVLGIRITLLRVRPPVWRQLDISASFSLGLLRHVIQFPGTFPFFRGRS